MSKVTIDLVKLIEQVVPQVVGSVDSLLLQQWLSRNSRTAQAVIVDLAAVTTENEGETTPPVPRSLQPRINDVTTFGDESELRIQVLAPRGSQEDLATDAYYGLLAAISHI
ncbi:MAG: hypothetical protein HS126_02335 [Anaerolineales bacterium]|nr:hypothetical protein [Anaerolineales bacterium]